MKNKRLTEEELEAKAKKWNMRSYMICPYDLDDRGRCYAPRNTKCSCVLRCHTSSRTYNIDN